MPGSAARSIYTAFVSKRFRYWVYALRHPEHRLEQRIAAKCRQGIETFLDGLAAEGILCGKILEVGAGAREQNKKRFGAHATSYCRSDLIRYPNSGPDVIADCTNLAFADGSLH